MLAKILKYQGWRHPIVVSANSGFIVAGHGRLAAAKLNGWLECPVDVQKFDDNAQEIAFLLSDNFIAELAETNEQMLEQLVVELGDFDHELLGLDEQLVVHDESKEEIEDDVPAVTKSISKLGDLYELGNHRLLCGDSTDKDTVERLMDGATADMVFTDPPYGIDLDCENNFAARSRKAKGHDFPKIIGDKTIDTAIKCLEIIKDVPIQILWGANYYCHSLQQTANWLVWDKREDEKERDLNSDCELAWVKCKRSSARIFRHKWKGMIKASEHGQARVHPTQKPIALAEWSLNEYGKESKNVIDLFGGSGSTLIACEKTKRKCFMMELDPHYIDVIVSRWCKYTGKYKIKRNGEEMEWPSMAE